MLFSKDLNSWFGLYAIILLSVSYSSVRCTTPENVDSSSDLPKIFDYELFKAKFHKSYSPVVSLRRFSLFLGRTIKIFQHNFLYGQQEFGYHLAQNEFTDLTGQELLNIFHDEESELEPVKEYFVNPDAPADSVVSVKRFIGIEEGYSSAALEDLDMKLEAKQEAINKHTQIKPLSGFLDNDEFPDPQAIMRQLENNPEMAQKISKFVKLKEGTSNELAQIEEANQKPKIKYKPIVSSNNEKYEPQMKASRSDGFEPDNWIFTNEKLNDLSIQPYSTPVQISSAQKSIFSRLLETVEDVGKSVVNFLEVGDAPLFEGEIGEFVEVPKPQNRQGEPIIKKRTTEYKIDWRKSGCISESRHQRLCNSCYAFATLSMFEYYYCKQNHESTSFSPQYLIDCGEGAELRGCDGGKISNTGIFIKKFGLELESMYPYLARKDKCPFDAQQEDLDNVGYIKPQITHWQRFDDLAAWYRWIRKGPIVVGINMPSDFFAYGGGVHDGIGCNTDMTHALLLVGFGEQDGKEFWLLKNSYSSDWGEEGYFKLSASAPVRCFNSVVVARVKFNLKIRDKVRASSKLSSG